MPLKRLKVNHKIASGCQEWTQFLSTMEKPCEKASKLRLGSNFPSHSFILRKKVKKYILFLHIQQQGLNFREVTMSDQEMHSCSAVWWWHLRILKWHLAQSFPFNSVNPLTQCIQVDTVLSLHGNTTVNETRVLHCRKWKYSYWQITTWLGKWSKLYWR